MGILKITEAKREGARLLIFLAGVSGGGKTKTAIEMAYGMTGGDGKKVGFLDTESGRGKLYADEVPNPYLYAELTPPFSPERYMQAINEFAATGIEVLIIDSGSHEWEGIGGCEDIAYAGNPRLPNWNKAKGEHKSKFMSPMLASPMHIILCLRARERAKPEKQMVEGKEKTVYVDMGLQAITEKNVMFEATVSLMLHDQGRRQDVIKCPSALQGILGRGNGYITQEDGAALRAWVDGASPLDPKVEHSRGLLKMAAEKGMEELQKVWGSLSKAHKAAIGGKTGCPAELKASAAAFDEMQSRLGSDDDPSDETLNSLNRAVKDVKDNPIVQQPSSHTEPQPEPQSEPQKIEKPQTGETKSHNDDGEFF